MLELFVIVLFGYIALNLLYIVYRLDMNQKELIERLEDKVEKLTSKRDEFYDDMQDPDNYYVDPNDWHDVSILHTMEDKLGAYQKVLKWIEE
tara:strand:+ start:150 stop:425 length:276 start_codon:yes stop_codon:yes gene_type:complete